MHSNEVDDAVPQPGRSIQRLGTTALKLGKPLLAVWGIQLSGMTASHDVCEEFRHVHSFGPR